jgi:hypothetical protein
MDKLSVATKQTIKELGSYPVGDYPLVVDYSSQKYWLGWRNSLANARFTHWETNKEDKENYYRMGWEDSANEERDENWYLT